MLKVAITTLGCKTNQFESAAMSEGLAKEGFSVVPFDQEADIYIINTCTVTARTDAESRRLVRRANRRNPNARIVVTGCYAQVAPDQLAAIEEVSLVIGNAEKKGLAALLKDGESRARIVVSDIERETMAEALPLETFSEHTRAFLQVQNGCDSFCSYCIVPYARGRSRSVMPVAVLAGIGRLAGEGFKEVVLTGIHLGGYGRDLKPATNLLALIQEIERQRLTGRLRLGSLEPLDITTELIDFLGRSEIVCPHLHIPLQSGSDTLLSRMNRGYGSAYFQALVERLVEVIPDINIGLDVIAGFPGESAAEFDETFRLIERLPVGYLHVFPFSARPGTAAFAMPGHLPNRVITQRADLLRQLGDAKRATYKERFIGRELEILVLRRNGEGLWNGLSRNYLSVDFNGPESLVNTEVRVKIASLRGDRLYGDDIFPSYPTI